MNTEQGKGKTGDGKKAGASRKPETDRPDMLMSYDSILEMQRIVFTKKVEAARAGVTKEQLIRLKEIFELDYDMLSELLVVTNRSLHLKKGRDILNRNVSDRIISIAGVYSLGYNVFGDKDMFHRWLRKPCRELDGIVPITLLDTFSGIEEVKNQLLRLDSFIK